MNLIYIVIDAKNDDGVECGYHIDSVWTSKRKAQKRCDRLNKELEEEPIYGVGLYQVEQKFISHKVESEDKA